VSHGLGAVLGGERSPGVYRLPSGEPATALAVVLAEAGWSAPVIEGYAVRDRGGFLRACAAALRLPDWSGDNWDALHECLTDLSWLTGVGHVVLWEDAAALAEADPSSWRTACEVFASAAAVRAELALPPLYLAVGGVNDASLPPL
jgi:hypothetical protein